MRLSLLLATVALAITACSFNPELTGEWQAPDATLIVSQQGDLYKVKVFAHNPTRMFNGTFSGRYKDGAIMVGTPCGNIRYSDEDNHLYFCGAEFLRVVKI